MHTKSDIIKNKNNFIWIAPFLAIGAIASCAVTDSDSKSSTESISFASAIKLLTGQSSYIQIEAKGSDAPVVSISKDFCTKDSQEEKSIEFKSLTTLGTQKSTIKLLSGDKGVADVNLNGQSLGLISQDSLKGITSEIETLCKVEKSNLSHDQGSGFVSELSAFLNTMSPNCKYRTTKDHFVCIPSKVNVNNISANLHNFNRELLSKVKRPPYILMRKLHMTRQFANLIEKESGLAKICELSRFSLPAETPIVMKTKEWKDGICVKLDHKLSRIEAYEALRLSYQEVSILKDLALKDAARGIVSLRLPKSVTMGQKNLYVELSPSEEVYTELVNSDYFKKLPRTISVCMHPFGSDGSAAGIKLYALGLLRQNDATCLHDSFSFSTGVKELTASITGDSKFVVSNYRGKLLRLPKGSYNYEISTIPSDPRADPLSSGTIIKKGSISWSGKRYTTIR